MYDIVYFVKESKTNEELRYSLRTLKISNTQLKWKDSTYLSTTEDSFAGEVGKQIRELFPDKCEYEE